jgi:hypothetical protein
MIVLCCIEGSRIRQPSPTHACRAHLCCPRLLHVQVFTSSAPRWVPWCQAPTLGALEGCVPPPSTPDNRVMHAWKWRGSQQQQVRLTLSDTQAGQPTVSISIDTTRQDTLQCLDLHRSPCLQFTRLQVLKLVLLMASIRIGVLYTSAWCEKGGRAPPPPPRGGPNEV